MKKILVPIDFTPASRAASEYAALLAKEFTASVFLLYVYLEPSTGAEIPPEWLITNSELKNQNIERVNKEISFLKNTYQGAIEGDALLGFTGDTISSVADTMNADLLVMGMKGHSNKFFGSTVTAVIRKSNRPVLVVPEKAVFKPFQKIALASDFDIEINSSRLGILFQLVEQFKSALHVVHVQKDKDYITADEVAGKMQLEHVFSTVSHSYNTVQNRDVEEGLNDFIQTNQYDLLALVAHRHNLLERLFKKIHSRAIIYETQVPMLVLKNWQ